MRYYSCDSHVVEPKQVFDGLEERFGERAPRIVHDYNQQRGDCGSGGVAGWRPLGFDHLDLGNNRFRGRSSTAGRHGRGGSTGSSAVAARRAHPNGVQCRMTNYPELYP